MKTVLVTGAGGYIGIPLVDRLLQANYKVIGLDRYFFGKDIIPSRIINSERFTLVQKDTRYLDESDFKGVDIVMDLAGLSNDPSCELSPHLTLEINRDASLKMGQLAKKAGVGRYIYSSSCSVYGAGEDRLLNEESGLAPVSAYAEAKIASEKGLTELASDQFTVTFLRNATVYGLAPRMRFDLVVNMMTMYAWRDKKIFIMGGGEQWRPLIHVQDVGKAFQLVAESDRATVQKQVFNVGGIGQNFRIKQIAGLVRQHVPIPVELLVIPDDADKRSYNISFEKIKNVLGYKPDKTIPDAVHEIYDALENRNLEPADLKTVTVKYYQYLIKAEKTVREVSYNGKIF